MPSIKPLAMRAAFEPAQDAFGMTYDGTGDRLHWLLQA